MLFLTYCINDRDWVQESGVVLKAAHLLLYCYSDGCYPCFPITVFSFHTDVVHVHLSITTRTVCSSLL